MHNVFAKSSYVQTFEYFSRTTVLSGYRKKSLLENAFDRRKSFLLYRFQPFVVLFFVHFFADQLGARSNFVPPLCPVLSLSPFSFFATSRIPCWNVKKAKRSFRYPSVTNKKSVSRPGFAVCEFSSLRRRSAAFNPSRSFDGHFSVSLLACQYRSCTFSGIAFELTFWIIYRCYKKFLQSSLNVQILTQVEGAKNEIQLNQNSNLLTPTTN